jgi:glycosyltransferase involved in cell wall biosynthesis
MWHPVADTGRSPALGLARERTPPGKRKIALLLANQWRGGMLRNAWALARLIARYDWPGIGSVEVVVGLVSQGCEWPLLRDKFGALESGVSVRRMTWQMRSVAGLPKILAHLAELPIDQCSIPRDHYGYDFLDCDGWIVFSSSVEGFVVPARPIAVYCPDLIQRYVREVVGVDENIWARQSETHLTWRRARCVFATTPQTRTDAVSYAGVARRHALLVPTLVDPIGDNAQLHDCGASEPYILWITNSTPHKNHKMAMEALRSYYADFGGTLPVVVAGADTGGLAPGSGADSAAARALRGATDVLPHLRFAGEVTNPAYLRLVSGAAVVWHNVIIDNGTFVAFDAARAGRHFVSSDYPQMRYLCERYGVAALWHPAWDPKAAAVALIEAGRRAAARNDPGHSLRQDSEEERRAAYGRVLTMLLGDAHA